MRSYTAILLLYSYRLFYLLCPMSGRLFAADSHLIVAMLRLHPHFCTRQVRVLGGAAKCARLQSGYAGRFNDSRSLACPATRKMFCFPVQAKNLALDRSVGEVRSFCSENMPPGKAVLRFYFI